jgi:hypothetical protein
MGKMLCYASWVYLFEYVNQLISQKISFGKLPRAEGWFAE